MSHRLKGWLRERLSLDRVHPFFKKQLEKPLPPNVGWFHTLGSLSLFLFVSQALTGMLLLVYYRPTVEEAFESVKFITTKAHMGWLYRQLHAWGGNLAVFIVFLHMLRTFLTGSYKKPREVTWVLGALLFFSTLIFGFTGYLLPWNQLSYWATTVGTEVAASIPFMGEGMKTLLRGGATVSAETLSRFFVVHVVALPWLCFFLILLHLFLVRLQGVATMDRVGEEKENRSGTRIPFFPHHVLKEAVVFFLLLGALVTLSILAPFELGEKANPFETPRGIRPDWYFLAAYQALKYFPEVVGIFVILLGVFLVIAWPFLDRSRERHPLKRPVALTIGIFAVLSLLILGVMGFFSETRIHLFGRAYEVDIYGIPHGVGKE